MPSNKGSFPLTLYFYEEYLILKGATASLRNCSHIICRIVASRCPIYWFRV